MPDAPIVIFGSINLDLVARVERLPAPGETVPGSTFDLHPGGKGANQALAARRAGHPVMMTSAVGTDPNADAALALLREAGADLSGVARRDDRPTGVALILVDAARGENVIAVVPGANGTVTQVPDGAFAGAGAVLLQLEIPDEGTSAALDAARAAGVTSFLNMAPWRAGTEALALAADVVIVNETEFAGLAETLGQGPDAGNADHVLALAGRLPGTLVVTLGAAGALASDGTDLWRAVAPRIEPVDTTGAGDTFCGYLAAARTEGMDWPQALDLACRAGALACLKEGAQPAIPLRAGVDAFT